MWKAEPTLACLLKNGQGVLNLTVEYSSFKEFKNPTSCLFLGWLMALKCRFFAVWGARSINNSSSFDRDDWCVFGLSVEVLHDVPKTELPQFFFFLGDWFMRAIFLFLVFQLLLYRGLIYPRLVAVLLEDWRVERDSIFPERLILLNNVCILAGVICQHVLVLLKSAIKLKDPLIPVYQCGKN